VIRPVSRAAFSWGKVALCLFGEDGRLKIGPTSRADQAGRRVMRELSHFTRRNRPARVGTGREKCTPSYQPGRVAPGDAAGPDRGSGGPRTHNRRVNNPLLPHLSFRATQIDADEDRHHFKDPDAG